MKSEINKWWAMDGNNTVAVTYPLNENSIVIDLGGYHGVWATEIINKYNPHMMLVEPIPQFYDHLINKFKDNPKVKILNCGISTNSHKGKLFLNADGTSKYIVNDRPIDVNFITITEILNEVVETYDREQIDLIQINIEGEEFPLLEQMLDEGTIKKFNNIQIQYHTSIENAEERREKIQERMGEYFNKIYDVPFVFEGWTLK